MKAIAKAYDHAHETIIESQEITGTDLADLAIKAAESLQRKLELAGNPDFATVEIHIS